MRRPWLAREDIISAANAVLASVGLSSRAASPVAALSHGDQRKLEVAMMMALEPDILMFDEPTAGMSVDEVPVVLDLIARLKQDRARPFCSSSTRWTSCARSPTGSSCCTTAGSSPTASLGRSDRLGDRAGSLSRVERGMSESAGLSTACTRTSAAITSCRASISTRRRARRPCCSGATAPARPRHCAPSWASGAPRAGRSGSASKRLDGARPSDVARARRRLCAGDDGDLLRPQREGKPYARRARADRWTTRGSPGSSAFSPP